MEEHVVLYEKKENIALLTFNRPGALNALNTEVNRKLIDLLEKAEADPDVRVIILTGSGEKAFVAGADIKEMMNMDAIAAREHAIRAKRVTDIIWNLKKPVIAAVHGFCLGGGLEYALACDIRIASEKARFALPEINLGIMPGSCGTQRLPRLIGLTKAKELLEEAMALGKKIAAKSAAALMLIKSAMNKGIEIDLESAAMFEIDCFGLCFSTEEQKQGMLAFVNKKK
jgi:enoyl-CoA hydratase